MFIAGILISDVGRDVRRLPRIVERGLGGSYKREEVGVRSGRSGDRLKERGARRETGGVNVGPGNFGRDGAEASGRDAAVGRRIYRARLSFTIMQMKA